jgi:hypothetical protein
MSKEEVERIDDQGMAAWENHDADAWASIFADSGVVNDWTIAEPVRDREGIKAVLANWVTAFPDMKTKHRYGRDDDPPDRKVRCTGAAPIWLASRTARSLSSAPSRMPQG